MKLLTTIIVSLLCLNVIGQQNRQQFTTQNGLSSNMIYTLFESKRLFTPPTDQWVKSCTKTNVFDANRLKVRALVIMSDNGNYRTLLIQLADSNHNP